MSYEESIREWLKQADEMAARTEEMLSDGRKPKEVAEQLIERPSVMIQNMEKPYLCGWIGTFELDAVQWS